MSVGLTCKDDPGTPPEVRVAERWADFAKALAIYPETNVRVKRTLGALREAIADARGNLELVFHENTLTCGASEHSFPNRSTLGWLRARLDHAALAGAHFAADVPDDSLVAFSQRLLSNFLRKELDPRFEDLWPDCYPGVQLLDRRFEGTFGEGGPRSGARSVGGCPSQAGYEAGEGKEVDAGGFIAGIMTDPEVAARLERLHGLVRDGAAGSLDETVRATDLLERVIDDLPAEAVKSRASLIESVCRTMDEINDRAGRGERPELDDGRSQYAQLLEQVSRAHFAREGLEVERLTADHGRGDSPTTGSGRERDAQITADVGALIAEFEQLPANVSVDIARNGVESRPEVLTVLLHYLVHLEHPERIAGLHVSLSQMLARPEPEDVAVLRRYVTNATEAEDGTCHTRDVLTRFLGHSGMAELARGLGLLEPERILAAYPDYFEIFLASLDLTSDSERQRLENVCTGIGAERLLAAGSDLASRLHDLPAVGIGVLLERSGPGFLPLVRLLLESHPAVTVPAAAHYLRGLDLPEPEAFLLYQRSAAPFLSREYLLGLIDHHLGRGGKSALSGAIGDVLCRHIRESGAHEARNPERLESIRNLARFPSVAAERLLAELATPRWLPLGKGEPLIVRRLARSIQQTVQAA